MVSHPKGGRTKGKIMTVRAHFVDLVFETISSLGRPYVLHRGVVILGSMEQIKTSEKQAMCATHGLAPFT